MIRISYRTIIAFLAGAVFAALGIIVWTSATPSAMAQESDPPSDNLASLDSNYILELNDNLKRAGDQIVDPDTKAFYDKLTSSYDLDQVSNADYGWLPDIDNIQRSALALPLQEAGKNIKDRNIADFYARFLAEVGLAPAQ